VRGWCAATRGRPTLVGVRAEGDPSRRCELTVRGPVAGSVVEVIRSRFELAWARGCDGRTVVLALDGVDQAAIRALLVLLWDSGHEVLALSTGEPE
jgi:hypothetical protein